MNNSYTVIDDFDLNVSTVGLNKLTLTLSQLINKKLYFDSNMKQGEDIINFKGEYHSKISSTQFSWIAIVFLDASNDCEGGLSFYKHKFSELNSLFPSNTKSVHDIMAKDNLSFEELINNIEEDSEDISKWLETDLITWKKNRLIIFNGNLFHNLNFVSNAKATPTNFSLQQFFLQEVLDKQIFTT